jgi:hypothetical protein
MIDEVNWKWFPNFYIILVASPGVATKTTSLNNGMRLLEKVPNVIFGPTSMTWQALLGAFKDAQNAITFPGEKNPELSSAITIAATELGSFLKPEDRELLDFLIKTWDGDKLHRRTVKEGESIIPNSLLNFIGCTTPSWMKDRMPSILIEGGLSSRVLFVFADKKAQLIPYPSRLTKNSEFLEEERALVHDLTQISKLVGRYTLSEESFLWGDDWYRNLWNGARPPHLAGDRFQGYVSRKQTHVHKLSMILAASKRNTLTIELEDLVEAEAQITALEHSMLHVFNSIGVSPEAKTTNEIVNLIKTSPEGRTTYKRLFQICSHTINGRAYRESVKDAIASGIILQKQVAGDWELTYVGRKGE